MTARMAPWPVGLRDRMRRVRVAAEARHNDPDVCVRELRGEWSVRSLDERTHPTPYWVGDSLEAAEAVYLPSVTT